MNISGKVVNAKELKRVLKKRGQKLTIFELPPYFPTTKEQLKLIKEEKKQINSLF